MNQFVLYIEDKPNNLLLFSRLVVTEGHTLGSAKTITEAWEKAVQMWPDLIVLDQSCLGVLECMQLMRRFKTDQRFYKVPIILLVAPDTDPTVTGDADLVLHKPISAGEIRRTVRQFLNQPQVKPIHVPRRQSRPRLWPQAFALATGL